MDSIKDVLMSIENNGFSFVEERFYDFCLKNNIETERQKPVGRYFADFYFKENNIVLEIDGVEFHSTKEQLEHDEKRNVIFNDLGYKVLRVNGHMANNYPENIILVLRSIDKIGTFFIGEQKDLLVALDIVNKK